ncbi:MAG: thiamine pyrophosphate-binding protein [Anaerolineales bacterium]
MKTSLTCAATIAQTLHASGVRHVFGHPGGEVVDLIEAIEQQGIKFILTGHESAAAFMAGALGRLTGSPGVCLATLGPGACNLVLGVGCAYLDRDPLLAFSARTATQRARLSNKQNLPLNEVFAPITKWSVALDGAATEEAIRSALTVARTPPRGPVFLSLPADIAIGPDRPGDLAPQPPALPLPDDRAFEEIVRALNEARRPIGVVGLALDPERDALAVRRFLAETGLPYVVLPQAKGVADEDGEMYLGTVAPGAGDAFIVEWLDQSDCLLGIGFDPVESSQDWHFHRPFYSLANGPVGFADFQPAAECAGNVSELLARLGAAYRGGSEWTTAAARDLRQRVAAAITPAQDANPAGLSPYHLMRAVREAVPDPTIVTTDVGAHKMLIAQVWRTTQPRTFLVSNGLSAMGYGVSAALAAALIRPEQPVVGVIGDGGFAMMVQELETARRMGVAPLLIVLCDRSLAVIKVAQAARGIPYRGVDFAPVDWARVAEGFGVNGITVRTLSDVQRAVSDWLAQPRLTVLAAPIDETLYTGLTY